ncbi:hypothetical protein ACJX0J_017061 [Zea mays]
MKFHLISFTTNAAQINGLSDDDVVSGTFMFHFHWFSDSIYVHLMQIIYVHFHILSILVAVCLYFLNRRSIAVLFSLERVGAMGASYHLCGEHLRKLANFTFTSAGNALIDLHHLNSTVAGFVIDTNIFCLISNGAEKLEYLKSVGADHIQFHAATELWHG